MCVDLLQPSPSIQRLRIYLGCNDLRLRRCLDLERFENNQNNIVNWCLSVPVWTAMKRFIERWAEKQLKSQCRRSGVNGPSSNNNGRDFFIRGSLACLTCLTIDTTKNRKKGVHRRNINSTLMFNLVNKIIIFKKRIIHLHHMTPVMTSKKLFFNHIKQFNDGRWWWWFD